MLRYRFSVLIANFGIHSQKEVGELKRNDN